jgi:hypothetical protein
MRYHQKEQLVDFLAALVRHLHELADVWDRLAHRAAVQNIANWPVSPPICRPTRRN